MSSNAQLDVVSGPDAREHCEAIVRSAREASLRVAQTLTFRQRAELTLSMIADMQEKAPDIIAEGDERLRQAVADKLASIRDAVTALHGEWPVDVFLHKGPVDISRGRGQTILLCSRPSVAFLIYESPFDLVQLAWDVVVAVMAGQACVVCMASSPSSVATVLVASISALCIFSEGLLQSTSRPLREMLAPSTAKDMVIFRGGKAGVADVEACLHNHVAPPVLEAQTVAPITVVLGSDAGKIDAVVLAFVQHVTTAIRSAREGGCVRVILPSQLSDKILVDVKERCGLEASSVVSWLLYDTVRQAQQICATIEDGDTAWIAAAAHDGALIRALTATHPKIRFLETTLNGGEQIDISGHALRMSVEARLLPCALAGSPDELMREVQEYVPGAGLEEAVVHPFRLHFDELRIGQSLLTHRRTITEADIVAFGGVSGDYFYMHFDEIAAAASQFGQRIAHGYFVLSAAAGLFVWPGEGPVLANYGLDQLRFIRPVHIGDTIRVQLTCKSKHEKLPAPGQPAQGTVRWDVLISNQYGKPVAHYEILTLIAKRDAGPGESTQSI